MKISNLFPALIISLCCINAKAQWVQKTSGTTNHLSDIHFPTADTGYAVGAAGTILKSIDAGETWTTLNSNTTSNFEGVYFKNANVGFVVGDNGIYKTINAGINWTRLNIPSSDYLRDIKFIDSQTGFCAGGLGAGGTILKTVDGGNTWTHKPSGSSELLSSISFPVPDTGYIVAEISHWEFLKTTDGGETWSVIPIFPPAPFNRVSSLETVFFTDANTGYIGGFYANTFIKTIDGGNSWVSKDTSSGSLYPTADIRSVYFPSSAIGYAVGGGIYSSVDSGNTWSIQNGGGLAIYFTNDTTGYIVGQSGTISKTSNGGGVTGVNSIINSENIVSIFPNPSNGILTIQINSENTRPFQFTLCNSLGEIMISKSLTKKTSSVNLSACSNGIYFYKLTSDKNIIKTGKIIKQ